MSRYHRQRALFRHIALLFIIPLVFASITYALLSQSLAINGTVSDVRYVSSQNLLATYTKSETLAGGLTTYTIAMTVHNNGTVGVTGWALSFVIPGDTSAINCPGTVAYTTNASTMTINGIGATASVAPGASVSFIFSFTSATPRYTLQNMNISGTLQVVFQTISGLSVQVIPGTPTVKGKNWTYPYTFIVTNTTGGALTAWQIISTYTKLPKKTVMDTTVNYTESATSITITSQTGLANGATKTFTASFTAMVSTWAIGTSTIKGAM